MSLIKCPECGHTVSDKAPTCPECGCPIAGNIIMCPKCGTANLRDSKTCAGCSETLTGEPSDTCENNGEQRKVVQNVKDVQEKYNKVVSDYNNGHFEEARAGIEELLAVYPNNKTFRDVKALMDSKQDNKRGNQPDGSDYIRNLVAGGDVEKAYSEVNKLISNNPSEDNLKLRAEISAMCADKFADSALNELHEGNSEKADEFIREGLIYDPENARLADIRKNIRRKRQRKIVWIFISVILFIALLISAAIYYISGQNNFEEETEAWNLVRKCESERDCAGLDSALTAYLSVYTDGFHIAEAEEMLDAVREEESDWNAALSECTKESMNRYMDKYSHGFFYDAAFQKLDSLSFIEAFAANTEESFTAYMAEFPKGRYYNDAQKWMDTLKKNVLTPDEEQSAMRCIRAHFDAISADDDEAVKRTVSSSLSSYIGKTNASWEDVERYMKEMHKSSDVRLEAQNCNVAKIDAGKGKYFYNVKFILRKTSSDSADEVNDSTSADGLSGTAILDNNMRITSLVLKKR